MRVQLEKRGVLGAGQAKKGGSLPRHIPILNIYGILNLKKINLNLKKFKSSFLKNCQITFFAWITFKGQIKVTDLSRGLYLINGASYD